MVSGRGPADTPEEIKPLSVAILAWELPPTTNGHGREAIELAQSLAGEGIHVRILTMDREDRTSLANGWIEIVGLQGRIGSWRRRLLKAPMVRHVIAARVFEEAVIAEHNERAIDLIDAPNQGAPAAFLAKRGIPVVLRNTTPNLMEEETGRNWFTRSDHRFICNLEKRTAHEASALISSSRTHAVRMRDTYDLLPGMVHRVIGRVMTQDLLRHGQKAFYPDLRDPLSIAYLGGPEGRKGLDQALKAFVIFSDRAAEDGRKRPTLTVAGVGEDELIERWCAQELPLERLDDVKAHGRLGDSGLEELLGNCHAVLAPHRYSSYGLAYREAAAFGRPVIACRQDPSALDFVEASGCGLLADTLEPEELADKLETLLGDPDLVSTCRENGLAFVDGIDRKELARRMIPIYRGSMGMGELPVEDLGVVDEKPRAAIIRFPDVAAARAQSARRRAGAGARPIPISSAAARDRHTVTRKGISQGLQTAWAVDENGDRLPDEFIDLLKSAESHRSRPDWNETG